MISQKFVNQILTINNDKNLEQGQEMSQGAWNGQ
jgi:hypothetical protein